jgi:hypothetical protein
MKSNGFTAIAPNVSMSVNERAFRRRPQSSPMLPSSIIAGVAWRMEIRS